MVTLYKGDDHHGDYHFHFRRKRGGVEGRFYFNGKGVTTMGKTTTPPKSLLKRMENAGIKQLTTKLTAKALAGGTLAGAIMSVIDAPEVEAGDQYTEEEMWQRYLDHVESLKAAARGETTDDSQEQAQDTEEETQAEEEEDENKNQISEDMMLFLMRY